MVMLRSILQATAGRRGLSCWEATCWEMQERCAGVAGTEMLLGAPPLCSWGTGAGSAEPRLTHRLTQRHQTAAWGRALPTSLQPRGFT